MWGNYVRDSQGGLETAIRTFISPDCMTKVELVANCHVATKDYFDEIASFLGTLDKVLFEEIRFDDSFGVDNLLQMWRDRNSRRARSLGLVYQPEGIDYDALPEHWELCDLTVEEVLKNCHVPSYLLGREFRSTGVFSAFKDMVLKGLCSGEPEEEEELDPESIRTILTAEARSLTNPLGQFIAEHFPLVGSAVIKARNACVCDRLDELTQQSGGRLHVGVLYGAAHMPGIENYLMAKKGYIPAGVRWVEAWNSC